MRAHTITTINRRRRNARRRRTLALAIGICALAIPATASAQQNDAGYSSVNSIAPPASSPSGSGGSQGVDSGYSSLNAITGSPADAPTFVSSSPSGSGEGFDWPSALIGAGAALAVAALGGAALLTVRRRSTVSPSPSSTS
jgi:hypothetical protein